MRQEVITRQQGRQAGEVGVAGIGRQRQDEERGELEHRKHEEQRSGKHLLCDLPDDGGIAGWNGFDVIGHRQHGVPMKSVPRITTIQVRVVAALRASGFLKAGMPLEMASVPVIAAQPAANDRRIKKSESDSVAAT